jgi:hypothetical protein
MMNLNGWLIIGQFAAMDSATIVSLHRIIGHVDVGQARGKIPTVRYLLPTILTPKVPPLPLRKQNSIHYKLANQHCQSAMPG